MLMFGLHLSVSLQLIALGLGAALLIWSKVHENVGTSLAKLIGYIIILLSLFSMICTGYHVMKYWSLGYFDKPCPMMQKMMSEQIVSDKNVPSQPVPQQVIENKNVPVPAMPVQPVENKNIPPQAMQEQTMEQPTMPNQMESSQQVPETMMTNPAEKEQMMPGSVREMQEPVPAPAPSNSVG